MSGTKFAEVWAEEPDTRVRLEPWDGGVILTVITPWLPNPIIASVADYRWRRLAEVAGLSKANAVRDAAAGSDQTTEPCEAQCAAQPPRERAASETPPTTTSQDQTTEACPHGFHHPVVCPQCEPDVYARARPQIERRLRDLYPDKFPTPAGMTSDEWHEWHFGRGRP